LGVVRQILFAAVFAAFAPGALAEAPLRASGTGTALGTMRHLAAAFANASPGDRIEILPSIGTSGAVKAVARRVLDLGLLGRALTAEEKALGVIALPYARTPLVFVAGPRAGVSGITAADAARLYRGEFVSWPSGERVRLVLRPRIDADTQLLRAISTEMDAAVGRAYAREGMLMAVTNQECNEMVAKTPGAFAPSSLTQLQAEGSPLVPLAWEGVAPTLATLASGAYPLGKTLHLVVSATPTPAVRRFLSFLRSREARKILEETGNIPLDLPALE
jgi:phosphate transport system substrate-binding protein